MNGCNVATPGFLGDSVGKTFEESGRSSTGGSIREGFFSSSKPNQIHPYRRV